VTFIRKPVAADGIVTVGLVVVMSPPVSGPDGVVKVQKNVASSRLPWEGLAFALPPRRIRRTNGVVLRSSAEMSATGARMVLPSEMNGVVLGPFAFRVRTPSRKVEPPGTDPTLP
jgi:hypothetical protein